MALFLFTRAIEEGRPIKVFNHGRMRRDFTYIDDIVEGVARVMNVIPEANADWSGDRPDPGTSPAPYRLYNIGNNNSVELMTFIEAIESALGKTAQKELLPLQPGDVPETFADVETLDRVVGFKPGTAIQDGIQKFIDWYRVYYHRA